MRPKSHVPLTLKPLAACRQSYPLRPQWHHHRAPALPLSLHRYSSSTQTYPERIAILGGGIAGLASAYFTSKEFPKSQITLFEAGEETGGWIKSRHVALPDNRDVLFELGPRTLRNAPVTAMLVQELGLIDEVVYTKRSEPGAKNRYLYYPDRLNKLPSSPNVGLAEIYKLWSSGILDGVFGLITEPMKPSRSRHMLDETVGSFLARRTDKRIANNLVSAVFHGIYAGDIWQLSAKTLLSTAWQLEGKYGTALGGFLKMQNESSSHQVSLVHPLDVEFGKAVNEEIDLDTDFAINLQEASMYSFENGLQTLVHKLQDAVNSKGNVVIKTESPIQSFKSIKDGPPGVEVVSGVCPDTHYNIYETLIRSIAPR